MADLLRFITCGSVDDGKSTLIGRLLFEAGGLPEDTLRKLDADSRVHGTQGEATDFALLVDGLSAEREQGITIDVAYRFFATPRRAFIVADTPGHEQYTRNMATGASTADLAILLVDARKGLLAQTRRHALICSLLGVRHMVLAVNKMDLVGHSREVFEAIMADFTAFARDLGLASLQPIPMSALSGGNLTRRDAAMPWYEGPVLLEWLEQVARTPEASASAQDEAPLRLPIQSVIRPDPDFRGFAGTIRAGTLRPGDSVRVLPSGQRARIARIADPSGDRPLARAGEAVLVTLDGEVDVSRGDWLVADAAPAEIADQFQAMLIWMSDAPLLPGRSYIMKSASGEANLQVTELRHRVDINTGAHESARTLALNEIGLANVSLDRAIAFEPYTASRDLGGFILIDRVSQDTVGAGLIRHPLRRSANIHTQALSVDTAARSRLKGHRPAVLWFTGLSGSGKSTLANRLDTVLNAQGCHTAILDGDNVRHGLNRDLGFTDADRVENIRRVAEVARLMADAGLIVLVSFISPFRQERALARTRIGAGQFYEIFVDAPLAVAEARDPKGLYAKARAGRLANFTGVDSPYESPETPDLHLRTDRLDPDEAIALILQRLRSDGVTG